MENVKRALVNQLEFSNKKLIEAQTKEDEKEENAWHGYGQGLKFALIQIYAEEQKIQEFNNEVADAIQQNNPS